MNNESGDLPIAAAAHAIRAGDVALLNVLLADHPRLAQARLGPRTLLHVATDWPGHFPNTPSTIAALIEAGADANAPFAGSHREAPLHWAASSNDVAALDALLDNGADIEAPGSVFGNGTALADAVAFGQWQAARRLIERGAESTLWQSAGLGLLDRIRHAFEDGPAPTITDITSAFWCACHGGQREAAEHLLDRGADINWIGYDRLTPFDAARRSGATDLVEWLSAHSGRPAADLP